MEKAVVGFQKIKCAFKECNFNCTCWQSIAAHTRNKHTLNSKEYYDMFLKKEREGICVECGKPTKFTTMSKGYLIFCTPKCSNSNVNSKLKKEQSFTTKYGSGITNASHLLSVREKISKVNSDPEKIKEALEARKKTNSERYGFNLFLTNPDILQRIKKTNTEKYGGAPLRNEEIRQKIKNTVSMKSLIKTLRILRYLNLELISDDYVNTITDVELLCKKCKTKFKTKIYYVQQGYGLCPSCGLNSKSKAQQELCSYINSLKLKLCVNSRSVISPYEVDIYIPGKLTAIEYNGLYWHSESLIKDKNYYLNKLDLCSKQNIRLIQIFEDEWIFHQDIVKARLKQILNISNASKIYARKCTIRGVPSSIKNEFLTKYHLQGTDNSPVSLGAFYNDELVAVMTFNHGSLAKGMKIKKDNVWELNRYCCNYNYHIPGIASKLLTFFKRGYEWKIIYSYADRRWSEGGMYRKLGFNLEKETQPNYWYIKGFKRVHRFALRKKESEPKGISEAVLRAKEGYTRIWDCGNLKFVMHKRVCNE